MAAVLQRSAGLARAAVGAGVKPLDVARAKVMLCGAVGLVAIGAITVGPWARSHPEPERLVVPVVVAAALVGKLAASALWRVLTHAWPGRFVALRSTVLREPFSKLAWAAIGLVGAAAVAGDALASALPLHWLRFAVEPAALVLFGALFGLQHVLLRGEWRRLQAVRHARERWMLRLELWQLQTSVVTSAVAEELLFRFLLLGSLLALLPGAFGGAAAAVVLSSLAFGLAHLRGGRPSGVVGMVAMSLFGLVLGGAVVAAQSLWPALILHAFIAGGWGVISWMRSWRKARESLPFTPFFLLRAGACWWLWNLEGSRAVRLCGVDSAIGQLFREVEPLAATDIQALNSQQCLGYLTRRRGGAPPPLDSAPEGLQLLHATGGWGFTGPATFPDRLPTPSQRMTLLSDFLAHWVESRAGARAASETGPLTGPATVALEGASHG